MLLELRAMLTDPMCQNLEALYSKNPPDKAENPLVPEDDEPVVVDASPPTFASDNPPESVDTTLATEEPVLINASTSTSFDQVAKPDGSTIDPLLSL